MSFAEPGSIAVILNARAGSAGADLPEAVSRLLPGSTIVPLRPDDDPRAAARRAIESGARAVVAAGGDGTVSAVAAELVGSSVRLGVLPCGTANSIAASLGIAEDLDQACAVIRAGHARIVDTARVGDRPLLLMASIGLHARAVTSTSSEAKAVLGPLAYVSKGATLLLGAEPFAVELALEGAPVSSLRASVHALTIANMAPPSTILAQGPPEVCPDDGLLDVTLVAFDGLLDAVATSLHLYRNALEGLPADRGGVGFVRATRVRVDASPRQPLMIDGEAAGETPFEVQCRPQTLAVLTPASSG